MPTFPPHRPYPEALAPNDTRRDCAGDGIQSIERMATPDGAGALNYSIRVPRGVIAVVCPWNLPLLLMT
jgi:acyl-CoA reductase-like NAD-dependent aldehyde dehydrogenase